MPSLRQDMDRDIMILELVEQDHKLLNQILEKYEFSNEPADIAARVDMVNNLIETMNYKQGIGISANQVGLPHRVLVLRSNPALICFNPRIIDQTTETTNLDETCLTYPNLVIPVKRPKAIKVRFQDINGEMKNEKFVGMTAKIFMHQLDLLNGIHYTNKANPIHVARGKRQSKILNRHIKRLARL